MKKEKAVKSEELDFSFKPASSLNYEITKLSQIFKGALTWQNPNPI